MPTTVDELFQLAKKAKADGDIQAALAALRKSFRILKQEGKFITADELERQQQKLGVEMKRVISSSFNRCMAAFKRFTDDGFHRLAMMELSDFHSKHLDLGDHPAMDQSRKILRDFLMLNPYPHTEGHIEASNLLRQIDCNFRNHGMAALQDEVAALAMAVQNPSFDLGGPPEAA